ncbi:hypothetical protein EC991_008451 [Linnemannia zychae]|nr:hypothetical protein EC991_008451 [Linnemannia zychae]
MYYRSHPKRKVWTRDTYVLFVAADDICHFELPREIKIGLRASVFLNSAGSRSILNPTRPTVNTKDTTKAPQSTKPSKRCSRISTCGAQEAHREKPVHLNKTTAAYIVGVNPISPAEPSIQDAAVTQAAPKGPTVGDYRQTSTLEDSSDSVSESAQTPPIPLLWDYLSDSVKELIMLSPE